MLSWNEARFSKQQVVRLFWVVLHVPDHFIIQARKTDRGKYYMYIFYLYFWFIFALRSYFIRGPTSKNNLGQHSPVYLTGVSSVRYDSSESV